MSFFSIVIPTRNRAHLFGYAIQSALNQTVDNYEIVVIDNYSDDNTAQVVTEINDKKVKYFKTNQVLSMTDNWEFALTKTSGDWIIFLCDDDAICPGLLEKITSTITSCKTSLIVWGRDVYYHNNCYEPLLRNKLICRYHTNKTINIDSQTQLAMLFARREDGRAPKMLNSCCYREVINKVVQQVGRFFVGLAPDYSASAAMLAVTDSYTCIDIPLMIGGIAKESGGGFSRYARGAPFALLEESQDNNSFKHVPLQLPVQTNIMIQTLLRQKEAMPKLLSNINVCWDRYFILCYKELIELNLHGKDISVMKKDFHMVLAKQSLKLQIRVYFYISQRVFPNIIRKLFRSKINKHPSLFCFKLIVQKLLFQSKNKIIDGKIANFNNIFEATQYLDKVNKKGDIRKGCQI